MDLGAGPVLTGRVVREVPRPPAHGGIAADGEGRCFYVSDEDEAVRLRRHPLLIEAA